jgi:uncharacterized membrane protein
MATDPEQDSSPEAPDTSQETKPKETSSGVDPKVAGLLCYLAGWITGIVFLLIEKDNKFVRFHAVQSIATFGAINVVWIILWFIPIVGWILNIFVWILAVVLWIVLMYKAYQEEEWKVPIAGKFAEDQVYKD